MPRKTTTKQKPPPPDSVVRKVLQRMVEAESKANQIETLLRSGSKRGKKLRYALQALLIEMSNNMSVHVDEPELAAAFYRLCAFRFLDPQNQDYHSDKNFRHVDLLLNRPSAKDIAKLIDHLDGGHSQLDDPFPERKGGHDAAN